MNTILVLLGLLCIVLLVNLLYSVVVSIYSVFSSNDRLIAKDDSSSANVLVQNVLAAEPETSIELVTKKIPIRYGVVEDGAVLSQVKKRVLISADFIQWLNSFRKQEVFFTKFRQNQNPAATELISFFSSDTPDALALELPNSTDLMVIKLLVDNNGIKSVVMYSSSPGCPGWASALVDAAAAAQYEAARTQETQKLFQATYDALSAEKKQLYAEWGIEAKNEHKLEDEDLTSFIFLAHWACLVNDPACLGVLKAGGANFDNPDNDGSAPAHYAAINGYLECLERLKDGGANFNIQDKKGMTPGHFAYMPGNYAAEENYIECLKILKAGGADFNIPDNTGKTLAHAVAVFGSEECLQVLKDLGADFNIQDNGGSTPTHCVAIFGSEYCLRFGDCRLNEAKCNSCEKRLKALKTYGASFDIQDNNGQTAREIASKKGIKIDDL